MGKILSILVLAFCVNASAVGIYVCRGSVKTTGNDLRSTYLKLDPQLGDRSCSTAQDYQSCVSAAVQSYCFYLPALDPTDESQSRYTCMQNGFVATGVTMDLAYERLDLQEGYAESCASAVDPRGCRATNEVQYCTLR